MKNKENLRRKRKPVPQESWQKTQRELEDCQKRVIQTLVPTILALGLVAVADSNEIGAITLACIFSILTSSGLYVASLSWKIFRNAGFLRVFDSTIKDQDRLPSFERIFFYFDKFFDKRKKGGASHLLEPSWLRSETTTAAVIFGLLALAFLFAFVWHGYSSTDQNSIEFLNKLKQPDQIFRLYAAIAFLCTLILFWVSFIIRHTRRITDSAISNAWHEAYDKAEEELRAELPDAQ